MERSGSCFSNVDQSNFRTAGAPSKVANIPQKDLKVEGRPNSATGFTQDLLIVVRFTIKVAVHPALNPALQRLKHERYNERNEYFHFGGQRHILGALSDNYAGETKESCEDPTRDQGSQEIDDSSAHNQANVHQPMANDCMS